MRLALLVIAPLAFSSPASAQSRADDAAAGCFPSELAARVELEPPEGIAARIQTLARAGGRKGARHAALREALAAAGCERIEERDLPELRTPNLVCTLPGATADAIVVTTSPERDGVGASALLPALVKVLRRQPRAHEFQIVALGRTNEDVALGAWEFADAMPKDQLPSLVVHLGFVGYGDTRTEPLTDSHERCVLSAIAARLGVALSDLRGEREAARLMSCEAREAGTMFCRVALMSGVADRHAFEGRGVRFAGLTARVSPRASLDAVAHYSAYRLLAAYLIAADGTPRAAAESAALAEP